MYLFFKSVAEAIVDKGLHGLVGLIPGAAPLYEIAESAWKKYRGYCKDSENAQQIKDIQSIVQAGSAEVKQLAHQVAEEVAAAQPEMALVVELYLQQIPASVRQSLKRREDPTGTTVPPTFALHGADDVVKLLPPGLPRFRPGDALPGRAGWVLEKQLGIGGFGEVWLARHPQFQSLLRAVKFCRDLPTRDRDMLHEGKLIDRLLKHGPHANIVSLIDADVNGAVPWLMYEYVEAGDLADLIHQWAALPPKERQQKAFAALYELATTISHFHRLDPPIVHRDLKPANILRDAQGRLRITDFGISGIAAQQMMEKETRGTATRAARLQSYLYGSYTPLYASPQQRNGAAPDPQDDVHALGVIGYQMLTGQIAQGAGPDWLEELEDARVNKRLIRLLGRCIAQKTERRPRDATEVAGLLKELIARSSPAAQPPTTTVQESARDPYADIREDEKAVELAMKIGDTKLILDRRATKSFGRWRDGAENGFAPAQYLYGLCFDLGILASPDDGQSLAWYRRAAQQGHNAAKVRLGGLYENGRGVPKDVRLAVVYYREAAEQGDCDAEYRLGRVYSSGPSVLQDVDLAIEWYRKASEHGHREAQLALAEIYYDDPRVDQDLAQAHFWCRKSAEQGLGAAQWKLGIIYTHEIDLWEPAEALSWYQRAADQGYTASQLTLSEMFRTGRGVPKDDTQAVMWCRKAAEQGHGIAQCNLAERYEKGLGVARDDVQAAAWYCKAAEHGPLKALRNLAAMYESGRGVTKDLQQARAWYRKAAARGDKTAKKSLERLGSDGDF